MTAKQKQIYDDSKVSQYFRRAEDLIVNYENEVSLMLNDKSVLVVAQMIQIQDNIKAKA